MAGGQAVRQILKMVETVTVEDLERWRVRGAVHDAPVRSARRGGKRRPRGRVKATLIRCRRTAAHPHLQTMAPAAPLDDCSKTAGPRPSWNRKKSGPPRGGGASRRQQIPRSGREGFGFAVHLCGARRRNADVVMFPRRTMSRVSPAARRWPPELLEEGRRPGLRSRLQSAQPGGTRRTTMFRSPGRPAICPPHVHERAGAASPS